MQEGNLVHRFRNNYATHLSADLIAQELHTQIASSVISTVIYQMMYWSCAHKQ